MSQNVCMFVYNNFTHDTRVLREAKSLTAAGYSVTIVAVLDEGLEADEEQEGIRIIRVPRNPIHLRLLRGVREIDLDPFNPARFLAFTPARIVFRFLKRVIGWIRFIPQLLGKGLRSLVEIPRLLRQAVRKTVTSIHQFISPIPRAFKNALQFLQNSFKREPEQQELLSDSSQQWGLFARIQHLYDKLHAEIEEKGLKVYIQENWRQHSIASVWLVAFVLPSYYFFLYFQKALYRFKIYALIRRTQAGFRKTNRFITGKYRKLRSKTISISKKLQRQIKRSITLSISQIKKSISQTKRNIKLIKRSILQLEKAVYRSFKLINREIKKFLYERLKQILLPFNTAFYLLDYYTKSAGIVSPEAIHICHAHDLNTLMVAYWVAKRHKAKLVYDSHELALDRNRLKPYSRFETFFLTQLEGQLGRRAHAVITVNESIADDMAKRHRMNTPTVVMNTPPLQALQLSSIQHKNAIRESLNIPSNYYVLLYSGSITFNRGLEKVIESLKYLPDCYLVLMGYGKDEYKEALKTVAQAVGVASRFAFFGPVPSEEVAAYAAGADLGVAPIENVCLSYYYCSPNKLFEYVAAGLPAVASDFPEMKKVVHQHEIGRTFDPSDPQDIARAIREVLDDPEQRHQMKQNTSIAAQAYNWENESTKLVQLYQHLS